jgi:transcriptional regulator with XRE-family HTH domain
MQNRADYDWMSGLAVSGSIVSDMDTKKILAERLRALREEAGWTQEQLAEQLTAMGLPLTQSQVGHIEKKRRMPSIEVLAGLARAFDTSVDYLLGRTENQLSPEDVEEELAAGGIGGQFERVMARLSHARRSQVVEYASYLAMLDQVSQEQISNLQALRAVMNVMQRSLPPAVLAQFWTEFAVQFPSLAGVLEGSMPEQKRVNER